MIQATITVISMIADGFIAALAGKITDDIATKLSSKPAQVALKQSMAAAIQRYASVGTRLDLVAPLLQQDGLLTEPAIAAEVVKILQFDYEPDLELIADRWRASLENPPRWRDFTEDARLLIEYFRVELRNTDVFRPVFDSQNLERIFIQIETSNDTLVNIATQLSNLLSLIEAHFSDLSRTFTSASPGIREQIRDYTRYIEEKTRDFVGRQFVFNAITQFADSNPRGYFIVRGDPGIGKSALSAQLVKTQGYAHHFNIRSEGINKPDQFLRNICAQLIARYNLSHINLPADATQDAGFLNRLLREVSDRLSAGEKAFIIVDALDEVDTFGIASGVNVLYLPISLPHGVYIILTTRKTPLSLRIECEQHTLDIEQDAAGNIADIHEFVERAAEQPGIKTYIATQGIDQTHFINLLVQKSQGNFMYLRYVLPEIERGVYQDLSLDALPAGLQNYYEDHWRRMRGQDEDAWFAYKLPIVMALTAVEEPVSIDLLTNFSRMRDRARIRSVLKDWEQFLYEERIDYNGGTQKRYRIYHASYHDFIAEKEEVADERVNLKDPHIEIANQLWESLFGPQ